MSNILTITNLNVPLVITRYRASMTAVHNSGEGRVIKPILLMTEDAE